MRLFVVLFLVVAASSPIVAAQIKVTDLEEPICRWRIAQNHVLFGQNVKPEGSATYMQPISEIYLFLNRGRQHAACMARAEDRTCWWGGSQH